MAEQVILVDEFDNQIGTMPKMQAHLEGKLHRAFSIFIFNSKGELLLQQRALNKYHSAGLWTNTCCSHQRVGESNIDAAKRRLEEEMGMDCNLYYGFNFIYQADVNEGIVEHEFDHVYFGVCDDQPLINTAEVAAYKYMSISNLTKDLAENPMFYTAWLKICFDKVVKCYPQQD